MRLVVAAILSSTVLSAQAPPESLQPIATMKQLMLDVIHPQSNRLLLLIHRGGPNSDSEWSEARGSAMTLAESGNLLIMRNRAPNWVADATLLRDAGAAAYKAAEAKDAKTLASVADRIDVSCTTCHKHFRPTVFAPDNQK